MPVCSRLAGHDVIYPNVSVVAHSPTAATNRIQNPIGLITIYLSYQTAHLSGVSGVSEVLDHFYRRVLGAIARLPRTLPVPLARSRVEMVRVFNKLAGISSCITFTHCRNMRDAPDS